MTDEPRIFYDIDVLYQSGVLETYTVEGGRDAMGMDAERVKLTLHPDPATVEEVIIHRPHVARIKTTQRTVQAERQLVVQ